MGFATTIQGINSAALGLFALYLLGRGDVSLPVIAIPGISGIKYLYLSSGNGKKEWAHYLSWFLTTPIMLSLIFSVNSYPLISSAVLIAANQIMIGAGYMATIQKNRDECYKWFWLGCFAFLPILYQLVQFESGIPLIILTVLLWSLYPVVWYLEREQMISKDIEKVSYSFLDFTSKAGLVILYMIETGLKF